MKYIILLPLIFICLSIPSQAADWFSLNGSFARVEYQEPNAELADSLLQIAEKALPRLARLHGLELSGIENHKVRIILTDEPDVSNGMALGNSVIIYGLSSMYMAGWTGTDSWYQTVLVHELAHHVTFLKIRRKFNLFGQIANLTVPRWFFEGIAQYFAESWNAYRGDLYIKNSLLAGKLNPSSLNDLNDGRLLYAAGNAFIRYLASTHGDSSLIKVLSYKGNSWFYNFNKAIKSVYKKNINELFADFNRHMVLYYGSLLAAYPESFPQNSLPAFGYRDHQFLPLSEQDSTWIITSRLHKNHLYKTAMVVKQKKDSFKQLHCITNNFATDLVINTEKSLVAYGRHHFKVAENQLQLQYDWFIYDILEQQETCLAQKIRARSAAFSPDNALILAETFSSETQFVEYTLDGSKTTLVQTKNPVGKFTTDKKGNIIAGIQSRDGKRDLVRYVNGKPQNLTNDFTDDRTPVLLNDSILVYNRYENGNPTLAVLNIKSGSSRLLLNDRHPYFLHGRTGAEKEIIVSRWDAKRNNRFFICHLDSLSIRKEPVAVKTTYPELAAWTRKIPTNPDTLLQSTSDPIKNCVFLPQFPMEHLITFGLPTYENKTGWGIYGISAWIEALQRQALVATFFFNKDYNDSFIAMQHMIMAFNSQWFSTYYHGPVIFGFENGEYLNLLQDIAALEWQRKFFIKGNPRFTLLTSASYAHYRHQVANNSITPFSYYGPSFKSQFNYFLPTGQYPFLPKRQIAFGLNYFKSLNTSHDFTIYGASLKLATSLMQENIGFKTQIIYRHQQGNLPPYKSVGVDRFYEFDIPRDYLFTKPVRGLHEDIPGHTLLWNSTELIYLLARKTNLKLLFLPVNNLALQLFIDYAQVEDKQFFEVYSYGTELSFGEGILRQGIGYAMSENSSGIQSEQFFLRLSVLLP